MSYMFYECKSLKSLPDISKWNISNVNNMSWMFSYCNSLKSLPDISKWNTSNVNDMSWIFYECNSLISLPDISKWNTSNVNNMNSMFYECKSLISINYYQLNNKLDVIDTEFNLSSNESKPNQSYLNNDTNSSDSNIYPDNSNEISSILEESEQKNTNLFSSKENFQFSFPLSFNRITNMREMISRCKTLI